jgi:predicted nucleic acid-binding protein
MAGFNPTPPGRSAAGCPPADCRPAAATALGHDSADPLIAATALEHGLTVVTRNLRHFTPTGVATLNPWQGEG